MSNKSLNELIDKILPPCSGNPATIMKEMTRELNAEDRKMAALDPISKIPVA